MYANFSRPQRLTVTFTLIFMLMAVNVAFWKPSDDTVSWIYLLSPTFGYLISVLLVRINSTQICF